MLSKKIKHYNEKTPKHYIYTSEETLFINIAIRKFFTANYNLVVKSIDSGVSSKLNTSVTLDMAFLSAFNLLFVQLKYSLITS